MAKNEFDANTALADRVGGSTARERIKYALFLSRISTVRDAADWMRRNGFPIVVARHVLLRAKGVL